MIGNDQSEVRDLLLRAVDELPGGEVSAPALLIEGKRAVRRRRRLVVGAAAVITAFAMLGTAALFEHGRATSHPSPADGRPRQAPESFDPGQRLFRLDWIPEDMPLHTYSSDRRTQGVTLASPRGPQNTDQVGFELDRVVTVEIGARGVDLFEPLRESDALVGRPGAASASLPGIPVAPVQGASAYLHTSSSGRETRLSWQYAQDAWAVIMVYGADRPEETARQFAAGMVWQPQPVTMPFLAVTPPVGVRLDRAVVGVQDGRWTNAQLGYLAPSQPDSPRANEDLTIGVIRGWAPGSAGRTTVAGRPAWVPDSPSGAGAYRVGQLPGACPTCVAEVTAFSAAGLAAVGGRDGALALAATVRLVADPDDMGAWRPV